MCDRVYENVYSSHMGGYKTNILHSYTVPSRFYESLMCELAHFNSQIQL